MRSILPAAIAIALLASPMASASAAIQATLLFHADAQVDGLVDATSPHGRLDLGDGAGLVVEFSSASGWLVTWSITETGPEGGPYVKRGEGATNQTLSWGPGSLTLAQCAAPCRVLVLPVEAASLSVVGPYAGTLAPTTESRVAAWGVQERPAPDSFYHEVPPGAIEVTGTGLAALASGRRLGLFVDDALLAVEAEGGREELDARRTTTPTTGPLGVPTGQVDEERFAYVVLEDARLTAARGTLLARAPALGIDGTVASRDASGTLTWGATSRSLDHAALDVDGRVTLDPVPPAEALPLLGGGGHRASLGGVADRVTLDGHDVPTVAALASPPAAAATVAVIGLLAVLVAAKYGAGAFYTRLVPATLLRNPNRKRVNDRVAAAPGSTVADLVRSLGMSEVVVRHHVRILEKHAFIMARGHGRLRGYFPAGTVSPQDATVRLLLRDATRNRIAAALAAAAAPLTQAEIASATGASPRLVSYHLALLERDDLVTSEGSQPRRYAPTRRLEGHLDASPASA